MKKLDFNKKDLIINLAGTCFWYWDVFHSFLESCGIPSSIYKQFGKDISKYQVMRSILELLERQQRNDVIENIATQFYNLNPSEEKIDQKRAQKLLKEFRNAMGKNLIEDQIKQKEKEKKLKDQRKTAQERQLYSQKILELKNNFLKLHTYNNEKQKRGYEVEELFFNILQIEEFEYKSPYKLTGEQIDGYFKYEKFDYLVEIKWTEEKSNQSDLSIFDGKIKGKGQSTRGFFLSINGFDNNGISKFSGNSPRILLMDGQELFLILDERTTFFDLMKLKTDHFARKGDIFARFSSTLS